MRASATALDRASGRRAGVSSVRGWLRQVACVVRTVMGAPDYERYVTHMRAHHPDREPMSRDEFMRQRLEDRYSRPGTRCC